MGENASGRTRERKRAKRKRREIERREEMARSVYGLGPPCLVDDQVVVLDSDGYKQTVPSEWGRIKGDLSFESGSAGVPYAWAMSDSKHDSSLAARFFSVGGILDSRQTERLIRSAAHAAQVGYDQSDPDMGNAGLWLLARMAKQYHEALIEQAKLETSVPDHRRIIEGEACYVRPPDEEAAEILRLAHQFGVIGQPSDDTSCE